jgi:hypothetical protein
MPTVTPLRRPTLAQLTFRLICEALLEGRKHLTATMVLALP